MNTSGYRDDTINITSDRKANKSTLPSLGVKKLTSERNKSQFLPKTFESSPKREITWSSKRGDDSYALSGGNMVTSFNSLRSKVRPTFE